MIFHLKANMLGYAIDALKEVGVYEQASLGGGTALVLIIGIIATQLILICFLQHQEAYPS